MSEAFRLRKSVSRSEDIGLSTEARHWYHPGSILEWLVRRLYLDTMRTFPLCNWCAVKVLHPPILLSIRLRKVRCRINNLTRYEAARLHSVCSAIRGEDHSAPLGLMHIWDAEMLIFLISRGTCESGVPGRLRDTIRHLRLPYETLTARPLIASTTWTTAVATHACTRSAKSVHILTIMDI